MTHPAPEVASRPAAPAEIPSGAGRFAAAAQAAGWAVIPATYARGTLPGEAGTVVDSVVVRVLYRDGTRAAARWIDGYFDVAWWLPVGRVIPDELRLRAITARIKGMP